MKIDYLMMGERLKRQRIKQNLTQEQLAEAVDLSVSHLSHIENGNTKTSLQTVLNIANVLNISIDKILGIDFGTKTRHVPIAEIDVIFRDCAKDEKEFLIENLKSLKSQLKKFNKKECIRILFLLFISKKYLIHESLILIWWRGSFFSKKRG